MPNRRARARDTRVPSRSAAASGGMGAHAALNSGPRAPVASSTGSGVGAPGEAGAAGGATTVPSAGRRAVGAAIRAPAGSKAGLGSRVRAAAAAVAADRAPDGAKRAAETGARIARGVARFGKTVASMASLVVNPVFLGCVAVVALVLVLSNFASSGGQLFGRTSMEDCSDGSADGTISIPAGGVNDPDGYKKATDSIMSWLMSTKFDSNGGAPMSKEQAAGFVSNLMMETSNYDPTLVQGAVEDISHYSNEQLRQYGERNMLGTGGAVGIFQLRGRALADLASYADGAGKQWSDASTQFEYVKTVLDAGNGFAGSMERFWQSGHDVRYYASTSNRSFEGSCRLVSDDDSTPCGESAGVDWRAKGEEQYKKAQGAFDNFGGAGKSVGGSCVTNVNSDTSSIVALAVSSVWPPAEHANAVCGADPDGKCAKPEYKDIRNKLAGVGYTWPNYADCGMFVATMVKATLDKDYEPIGTAVQYPYLMNHPEKWQPYYNKSEAQPGDVWITQPGEMGHTVVWVGQQDDGVSYTAEASWDSHSGKLQPDRFTGNLVDEIGRQYTGFHFVGTPDPAV